MTTSTSTANGSGGRLEQTPAVDLALVGGIVGGVVGAALLVAAIVGCVLWRQRRVHHASSNATARPGTPGYTNGPEMVRYNDVDDVRQPKSALY